jgi:hypothetical protein
VIADAAGLVFCNALFLGAGAGVVRLLGGWRTPRGLARTIGVSYLAGVAAVGVTFQVLLAVGAPFNRWVVIAVCLALAALGALARTAVDPSLRRIPVPRYLWPVAIATVAMVALLFVDLWFQPLGQWDAWSQWTAKARSIVIFHGIDTPLFQSLPYRTWNPDYPILLPSIEAADFTFMRHLDTRAIHLQFGLLYAGFLLSLLELLRGRVRESIVWPLVLAIAVAPAVQIQTASALADVPVAIFFATAGIFAWRWLVEADRVALRLFVMLAAGAYATKFEGKAYVGALSATLVVLVGFKDRTRVVTTVVAALAALAGVVPWMLWTWSNHATGSFGGADTGRLDSGGLLVKADRIPVALISLATHALDPRQWLLLAVVILAAVAAGYVALPRRVEPWLVAGTIALIVAGLCLAYWSSALSIHAYLEHSARRVVTAPVLFGIALVPLLLEAVLTAGAVTPPFDDEARHAPLARVAGAPPRDDRDRQYPLRP